jgi:hypothetical protein
VHVHSEGVGVEQGLHSVQAGVLRQVVVLAAVEALVEVEVELAWGPKASAQHRAATSCAAMTVRDISVQACRKIILYWLRRGLVRQSFGAVDAQTTQYKTG